MATNVLNYDLQKVIRILPGYDPFDQAGDCRFDEHAARHVIEFVEECCTHVKGELAGTPLILEPWEKAIFANLWGWKLPNGLRRYREMLAMIPRGNAKTTIAAAMVCVGLFLDDEPGSELYSSASDLDQASTCFKITSGMIANEPMMESRADVMARNITVEDKVYRVLSSKPGGKHSFNVQMLVNDELHAQATPDLTEVLMTGMGKRRQPLAIHITTSDWEREGSICNKKHDYATAVRDNKGDPAKPGFDRAFLPVIYEATKEDDWTDPDVWHKANPNLGVSIPLEYFERECKRAQEDGDYENTFKRLHLNIRTQAVHRWRAATKWNACQVDGLQIEDFEGKPCWLAIDVATSEDFNAAVFVFRDDKADSLSPAGSQGELEGGKDAPLNPAVRVAVFPYFWVPEKTAAKREREHRIPYATWARGKYLRLCDEPIIGADLLVREIVQIIDAHKLNVREVAVDRAFQGLEVVLKLAAHGFTAFPHGQKSLGMIGPTKQTKDLILSRKLRHAGHPVMDWMMNNVVVHAGDNNEFPMRDKSKDKIDGPVAMIMGIGRAVAAEPEGSVYDRREVLEL